MFKMKKNQEGIPTGTPFQTPTIPLAFFKAVDIILVA
jgi:hypothetical protein